MEICESGMVFSFREGILAVKYDDCPFYRKRYNAIDGGKGMDILASEQSAIYFIEVKNCEGTAENQDKWRRQYSGTRNMNTLASEIAGKVAHTCACLAGAATYGERSKDAETLLECINALDFCKTASFEKTLFVLLFLEGDFSCKTRPNEAIYSDLRQRIERRLKWLNCRVDVVSTKTHRLSAFEVTLQHG